MFLNITALLSAISISGVAAYYSIYGLTAIFSGVFWPIVIMGTVLEIGKIVVTVWLHTYWNKLRWFLKAYMSAAVVVLMFITSMGIFGYLSRAHIEVTSAAGGSQLLVAQVDQNISIEQKRIDDARKVMTQMDDAVASLLRGSGANAERDNNRTAALTTQATKLRDSQKKERASLNEQIDAANNRIADLSKQKLKLDQEQLKIEAEVGPIKYIAQMIYDDGVGKDVLERAVRWVIIVIVAVFDPLAVALVLGVTMVMNSAAKPVYDETGTRDIELPTEVVREVERIIEVPVEVPVEVIREVQVMVEDTAAITKLEEELAETLILLEEARNTDPQIVEKVVERVVEVPVEKVVEIVRNNDAQVFALTSEIDNLMGELHRKDQLIHSLQAREQIAELEQLGVSESEFDANMSTSMLGKVLPTVAISGDLFYNTANKNLYKYNGITWIEVDKNTNTSYTYDEHWQHWMTGSIGRGETDWDDLTSAEQSALEKHLNG